MAPPAPHVTVGAGGSTVTVSVALLVLISAGLALFCSVTVAVSVKSASFEGVIVRLLRAPPAISAAVMVALPLLIVN